MAARGGVEKIKAIKSVRMTGKIYVENMHIGAVLLIKRPGAARVDASFQGMKMVRSFDGESAWQIDMLEGKPDPEKMTGDDEKEMKDLADIDGPLVDYKAKGNTVELVGKEDLEATPVYKLKVTDKSGDIRYIYLDCQNYLELKTSARRKVNGRDAVSDEYYSDYKAVGGVFFPHSIESKTDGEVEDRIVVDKIELNVDIDDTIFKMPKKP